MVAEDITVLPIGFTEVTIYDFPGEEYAFRRRKHFSVVVSWSTPFHGRERPTEKSFSVVVRQQAEGLVEKILKIGEIRLFFHPHFPRFLGSRHLLHKSQRSCLLHSDGA